MITTDYVPGSPCWLDLGTPDVPSAAAFYGAVFGWSYASMGGMEGGVFRRDGKAVAGLGRLTEQGARSAWMVYFSVTDADAATRAVEAAGGTVRVAPMTLDDAGRMAQYSDPQGGQFAVWEPGTDRGAELVDEPGSLCWTELFTSDAAAAREFYGGVLGWRFSDMELPGGAGTYALITPAGLPEERMHGGLMRLDGEHLALTRGRPYWHPVFAVADCDAAAASVTGHGGATRTGPQDVEGIGRLAVCLDPWNADFVVLAPAGADG
ncbi:MULTISPECIES: VOC family protein [Streptomyces]|uniref:VOC family protein n=1 Tax=Streptomyces TaxID=1883 RepID=UPI000F766049|nr:MULTISPECIES: VOC family protein [Streptomyces]RST07041.1 VOC family protein [Streptomyces sp. WAC07149]GLX21645.1 hydroxylase [Streptomyces lavendulae subsp. lavendulae]GLX29062.1 hydroxylase [Streptomyces lavendulae subsp. lavendulae]